MPKYKPLLPEERMHNTFYKILICRAAEAGLYDDQDIAKRLGISQSTYSKRKNNRTLYKWRLSDLPKLVKKLRFTMEDIEAILKEGMSV